MSDAQLATPPRARRPGSLPLAVGRHALGLVAAPVVLLGAVTLLPLGPFAWVIGAAAAGALAGLVDRGWLGLVFVEIGIALGVSVAVISGASLTHDAAAALATAAPLYVTTLLGGAAAYVILRLVRHQLI